MVLTSHRVITDVFNLENVVQQTGIVHAKNIIIDTLREIFRNDRAFAFRTDVFGFPKTPSHLGLDPGAGLDDEETTRIFIGGNYRYDIKFNPSVWVKSLSTQYKPVSFNQNKFGVKYTDERVVDGYGNETIIRTPHSHVRVGAWDQTFEIKVITEDSVNREEITDIIMVSLQGSRRDELEREGVFIRSMSTGPETEQPYSNDHLYMISITLQVRTEWKIQIPISDVCERIGLCVSFDSFGSKDPAADALNYIEQISMAETLP